MSFGGQGRRDLCPVPIDLAATSPPPTTAPITLGPHRPSRPPKGEASCAGSSRSCSRASSCPPRPSPGGARSRQRAGSASRCRRNPATSSTTRRTDGFESPPRLRDRRRRLHRPEDRGSQRPSLKGRGSWTPRRDTFAASGGARSPRRRSGGGRPGRDFIRGNRRRIRRADRPDPQVLDGPGRLRRAGGVAAQPGVAGDAGDSSGSLAIGEEGGRRPGRRSPAPRWRFGRHRPGGRLSSPREEGADGRSPQDVPRPEPDTDAQRPRRWPQWTATSP